MNGMPGLLQPNLPSTNSQNILNSLPNVGSPNSQTLNQGETSKASESIVDQPPLPFLVQENVQQEDQSRDDQYEIQSRLNSTNRTSTPLDETDQSLTNLKPGRELRGDLNQERYVLNLSSLVLV